MGCFEFKKPLEKWSNHEIEGTLTMFDRLIFRGYVSNLFPDGAFARFLARNGVLLKDFAGFVQQTSAALKAHVIVMQMAQAAGRPYEYLAAASTKASGASKEDRARLIAARDHVTEGLICVFAVLEPCQSFVVQGDPASGKLVVRRKPRKCLHFYLYFLDAEFGFMHVRLQSWFPFDLQIYTNGREWVARRLLEKGLTGERYDNTFLHLQDAAAVPTLCDEFAHREWARVLNAFARRVNPKLALIRAVSLCDQRRNPHMIVRWRAMQTGTQPRRPVVATLSSVNRPFRGLKAAPIAAATARFCNMKQS